MTNIYEAGAAVNGGMDLMDDYQAAGAAMTDAFSDTDYEDTNAEIPIMQMATRPDGTVDEEMRNILNSYDSDGDGHISRDEYNKAMADLKHKTDTLTSVMQMVSDTASKIAETLMSVSKFF